MPAPPLADLETIDLETVLTPKAEIYSVLEHGGRFQLVDGVFHRDPEQGLIVGYVDVRSDAWWVPDHIPGRPLFPGVLMIEAAAQLGCYDFHLNQPADLQDDRFVGFGGIGPTRFRGTVQPDCRLILVSKCKRVRSRTFTYDAQGFVDGTMVFETEVTGLAL